MTFFQIFLVVLIFRCSFAAEINHIFNHGIQKNGPKTSLGRQTGESPGVRLLPCSRLVSSDLPLFSFFKFYGMETKTNNATAQAKNVHQSIRAEILKHFPNLKSIKVKKHHRAGRVLVLAKDEHKRHIKATGNYYNALVNFMGSQERVASYFLCHLERGAQTIN
jgi:hypothetical protein